MTIDEGFAVLGAAAAIAAALAVVARIRSGRRRRRNEALLTGVAASRRALHEVFGPDQVLDDDPLVREVVAQCWNTGQPTVGVLGGAAGTCCHKHWGSDNPLTMMLLCPQCGNKRCPKASDCSLACTGSNEPGQPGSVYAV